MLGANSLSITNYALDLDGSAELRLSVVYDDLVTIANQRYVLWRIGFDHTQSVSGNDADPETCNGAGVPLNLSVLTQIGLTNATYLFLPMEPNDAPTTWNGGNVRAQPTTWGHVKGLYR